MKIIILSLLIFFPSLLFADARTDDLKNRFKSLHDPLLSYRKVMPKHKTNSAWDFKYNFLKNTNHAWVETKMQEIEAMDATMWQSYLDEKTSEEVSNTEFNR